MPELPELEVVREVLARRVVGRTVAAVETLGSELVLRDLTQRGLAAALTGSTLVAVSRRGQFLTFTFQPPAGAAPAEPLYIVINPKLTGRLQLATAGEKRFTKTHVVLKLDDGQELRYIDQKSMGQLYLTPNVQAAPGYAELGPEALEITGAEFAQRLRPYRGEIKGILIRGEFVAGIGNAYADEILWAARINPFRKRTQLTVAEIDRLYAAMRETLAAAIDALRVEMGEAIHREPRTFLAVHLKAGQPCPRCGSPIAAVTANQRVTNFCRTCQPGGLIKGM